MARDHRAEPRGQRTPFIGSWHCSACHLESLFCGVDTLVGTSLGKRCSLGSDRLATFPSATYRARDVGSDGRDRFPGLVSPRHVGTRVLKCRLLGAHALAVPVQRGVGGEACGLCIENGCFLIVLRQGLCGQYFEKLCNPSITETQTCRNTRKLGFGVRSGIGLSRETTVGSAGRNLWPRKTIFFFLVKFSR